jgi:hypothetical protein
VIHRRVPVPPLPWRGAKAQRVRRSGTLLLALLCACGRDTSPPAGGTAGNVVQNRRSEGWDAAHAWRLIPIGRIAAEGDGPKVFGQLVDVALDGSGRVWVADGLTQEVKVFGADGTHVRTIGRRGAGPGEFGSIAGMDWGPEGNLWILDGGNARYAVYDTTGRLVATRPRPLSVTVSPWPGGFDRHGRLVDMGGTRRTKDARAVTLIRFSPDGGRADTLHLPPVAQRMFGSVTSGDAANRRVREAPVPFMPRQVWAVDTEGYAWVARSDEYRITRTDFDGTVQRVIALDNVPPRVTREDKNAILKNYAWFEAQGGTLDRSLIPDEHADLLGFFVDDENYLWVCPTYPPGEPAPLDVFDEAGTFLGSLQAPAGFLPVPAPAVRGGLMAAVSRDADGVDSVVLFQVSKGRR